MILVTLFLTAFGFSQDEYFQRSLSSWMAYNQYAPAGTLRIQLGGTFEQQLAAGSAFYSISGVDITGQPATTPDGKFKIPVLTFSGRTGLKYYPPLGMGNLRPYVLGDVGLSGSLQNTLGSYTGGGGTDYQFKPHWAAASEFRVVGRQGTNTDYMVSFGLKFLTFRTK